MHARRPRWLLILSLALVILSGCRPPWSRPTATPPPATPTQAAMAPTATRPAPSPTAPLPTETPTPAAPAEALIGGDLAHTRVYAPAPFAAEWTLDTGAPVISSPPIVDGVVYFGSTIGRVYAVELETGKERWSVEAGNGVVSSPAVAGGLVLFGTISQDAASGQIRAVDQASGEPRWQVDASGVQSSPAVADSTVYAGAMDGTFYALDLATGAERWRFQAGPIISSAAVAGGRVLFGDADGLVYALDAATGQKAWQFKTGGEVISSPAVVAGTVYIGGADGKMYALELGSGKTTWQVEVGGPVLSSPAVVDGVLYAGDMVGVFHALKAATGEEKWRFDAGAPAFSSAAVAEGTLYFGSMNGRVYALEAATGRELWRFQTGGDVFSSPSLSGDAVVFGSFDGKVYALRRDGPQMAIAPTPSPPPLLPTPTLLPPPPQEDRVRWWNDRVFYEVFVRSFYDSDGDGIGDLQGLIQKLDYLNDGDPTTTTDLGVTGMWIMPVAQSPSYHGYDVTDYLTIEEDYGTNADFLQLIDEAHRRGIAVIFDLVLNHTSNQHPWFLDALTPGSEHESWYIWTMDPPDFQSPWGSNVWHKVGLRYYYGLFWEGMPDLNYENGAVTAEMFDVIRFWLVDMKVDGFRLDAVRHLIEDGAVQANTPETHAWLTGFGRYVHTIAPDALTIGEVWDTTAEVVRYQGEETDLLFEFDLATAILDGIWRGNAEILYTAQEKALAAYPPGQYAAFLTNHDQNRVMNQLRNDAGAAHVAATLLLTNPGLPFIYYGEEVGMVGAKPDERIRTPMQWDAGATAGFTAGTPWQPLASAHDTANVATQESDPGSLLNHYRALIRLRTEHAALRTGETALVQSDHRAVYAFLRSNADEALLVVANLGKEPVSGYTLSLAEGPLGGTPTATLLLGKGAVAAPAVNAAGGFDAYTPLETLPGRSSLVMLLEP